MRINLKEIRWDIVAILGCTVGIIAMQRADFNALNQGIAGLASKMDLNIGDLRKEIQANSREMRKEIHDFQAEMRDVHGRVSAMEVVVWHLDQ